MRSTAVMTITPLPGKRGIKRYPGELVLRPGTVGPRPLRKRTEEASDALLGTALNALLDTLTVEQQMKMTAYLLRQARQCSSNCGRCQSGTCLVFGKPADTDTVR